MLIVLCLLVVVGAFYLAYRGLCLISRGMGGTGIDDDDVPPYDFDNDR